MTIHTEFRKGQRLIVTMRDGKKFVDKYDETKSGVVILRETGKHKIKDIRAITIYRGQNDILTF